MTLGTLRHTLRFAGVCALLACLGAPAAYAEDEPGASAEKQIKEQMEKILELMKENEAALLELSTGGAGSWVSGSRQHASQ